MANTAGENHNHTSHKEEHEAHNTCNISIKDIQMAMEVFNIQQKPAKTQEEAMQKPYQFWSTQPVPKMGKRLNINYLIVNSHSKKIKSCCRLYR